jgi:hypothetical protein
MFVSQHLPLLVSAELAQARLVNMVAGGGLGSASHSAYACGIEQFFKVGPFGQAPGPGKLVRALFMPPVCRDDTVVIGMRWEATGPSGGLFPVLDANITVAPGADASTATLTLEGSYRPPLGALGAGLDRVLLNKVATATVRAMLGDVAKVLLDPGEVTDGADPRRLAAAGPEAEPGSGPA